MIYRASGASGALGCGLALLCLGLFLLTPLGLLLIKGRGLAADWPGAAAGRSGGLDLADPARRRAGKVRVTASRRRRPDAGWLLGLDANQLAAHHQQVVGIGHRHRHRQMNGRLAGAVGP